MKIKIIYILSALFCLTSAYSNTFQKGKVYGLGEDNKKEALSKANVVWLGTQKGVLTDKDGNFSIQTFKDVDKLIISYIGYKSDTVIVNSDYSDLEIKLQPNFTTDEVKVVGEARQTMISTSSIVNTTTINSRGLQKAACCNLAESFLTNAAAEVEYSDAMSGARQIKLLGLKGTYTQLQTENIPAMRGLASSFGLGYIPGPWMESISISKGTSSVINGFESITGQINIEYKKPENDNPTHFNFYGDHIGRVEANTYADYKVKENLSTMMFLHGSTHQMYHDFNNDGFIDHPQTSQINVMNRWKYHGEIMESMTAANLIYEDRKAGQKNFLFDETPGSYGMDIKTTRFNVFTKNGFILDGNNGTSIGTILSYTHHNQKSFYGINNFEAQQNSFYANLMYATSFSHEDEHSPEADKNKEHSPEVWHKLTAGTSFQYDNYFHTLNDTQNSVNEIIPGVFTEYSFLGIPDVVLTGGMRADYHNTYGTFLTPRFHVKYSPDDMLTLRLSAGRGSRTPYPIAENSFVLASSRKIIFSEEIMREEANTYGASVTSNFDFAGIYFTLNADYFHTRFENQLIVDMDKDAQSIYFYNLHGESYSNSLQIDLISEITENLTITTAYRYNEVKTTTNGILQDKPFQSFHKGFLNASYNTSDKEWSFDFTVEYNGSGRIPPTHHNPAQYTLKESFEPFFMLHGNINKRFGSVEIYLGGENLLDFVQANPILAANDPFGNYFDSSMIWGPVIGRKIYLGVRYNIN